MSVDYIPPGELGSSRENPYLAAPLRWEEDGLPYGAWCKCWVCGDVGRSTLSFDFHAAKTGDPLRCEACNFEAMLSHSFCKALIAKTDAAMKGTE